VTQDWRKSVGPWRISDAYPTSIDEKSTRDQRLILIVLEAFLPRLGFLRGREPRQSDPAINSTQASMEVDARGRRTSGASTQLDPPYAFDPDPHTSAEPILRKPLARPTTGQPTKESRAHFSGTVRQNATSATAPKSQTGCSRSHIPTIQAAERGASSSQGGVAISFCAIRDRAGVDMT
jgi:hypothetical protein